MKRSNRKKKGQERKLETKNGVKDMRHGKKMSSAWQALLKGA